jgi:Tfp pilus assembly protein PilF
MARRMTGWTSVCVLGLMLSACATPPHKELSQAMTLQQQARQAYARGDLVDARADYVRLTHMLPNDVSAWFHLGNVYARSEQPQLAVEAYRHVLSRDATHAKAWHNMGVVLMQQAQAAFAQSAQVAEADPELRRQDMSMANRLDALVHPQAAHEASTSGMGAGKRGGTSP